MSLVGAGGAKKSTIGYRLAPLQQLCRPISGKGTNHRILLWFFLSVKCQVRAAYTIHPHGRPSAIGVRQRKTWRAFRRGPREGRSHEKDQCICARRASCRAHGCHRCTRAPWRSPVVDSILERGKIVVGLSTFVPWAMRDKKRRSDRLRDRCLPQAGRRHGGRGGVRADSFRWNHPPAFWPRSSMSSLPAW